jgi:hypothetical protein
MARHTFGSLHWLGAAALFATSCAGLVPTQRVQDAATDYATALCFGRMDVAQDQVNKTARDAFARQHAAWGNGVRVLDCEVSGLRLRDSEHADALLAVSWQRSDESEMRSTQIAQRWSRNRGPWKIDGEERARGDAGLLGDPDDSARALPVQMQFRTITIR